MWPTKTLLVAAALAAALPQGAIAQEYPAQPIKIIVGFAAGGAPDTLARIVGDQLGKTWKQTVVVENRTGANGNIAMTAVAKAPADGYTLALVPVGNAAVNPSLFPDLPYDPVKDFAPITLIANVENVLVVSGKSDIKTLPELIARGRAGENITYATPGAGSIAHLAAELLARAGGFKVTHIGYRGVTPALTDVLRGEVTMMFAQLSTAKPFIESGELRALGVASKNRSAAVPQIPTVAEAAGLPEFEAVSWYAMMAPTGTPQVVIDKLQKGIAAAINQPEAKKALEAQGAQPVGGSPAELAALIAADTTRWGKVVREADIKLTP